MSLKDQDQQNIRVHTFTCPTCSAEGLIVDEKKQVKKCSTCNKGVYQKSQYGFWNGKVLYWGRRIDSMSIMEERTKRIIRGFINGIAFLIGVIGLVLGLWFMIEKGASSTVSWRIILQKDWRMAIFWISLLIDLYIYYRLIKESTLRKYIPKKAPIAVPVPESMSFRKLQGIEDKKRPAEHIEISDYFTQNARKAIEDSWEFAHEIKHYNVTATHLLYSLLGTKDAQILFSRLGTDPKNLVDKTVRVLKTFPIVKKVTHAPVVSKELGEILFDAYKEAATNRRDKVHTLELLIAISRSKTKADEILYDIEIEEEQVKNITEWIHFGKRFREKMAHSRAQAKRKPKGTMNRSMTARPTPLLDSISRDFTQAARAGALFPLVGRKKEMDTLMRVMESSHGNALIIGDAGVGKSTLVNGFAERMTEEDVPPVLQDKRLVGLEVGALVAGGSGGQGALEQKMLMMMDEIMKAGNIVLFIDDINYLIGAGSSGSGLDIASMLNNALSEGRLKIVATATTDQYSRIIQNNAAFLRRFQKIKVEEMNNDEAIQTIEAHSGPIEGKHRVFLSYQSIDASVRLTRRYIHDRYLPAKAIDVVEEAAVYVRNTRGEKALVTQEDVAHVLTERTGITITKVTDKEKDKLMNLEQTIHERIIGQEEAVKLAAQAIRRARTELRDPNRPIINLLFLGPTGVGKTELAKTIADVYFGAETNMIRTDMSEYQERSSITRLIGAPPGQGGSEGTQGQLTDAVRQSPFSLILLDELEKAHPEILNIFLQVLDDGRLTDGTGRTVDFTNSIIIATSNAGSQYIQDSVNDGVNTQDIKEHLINEVLRDYYRPEFLNRFDGVVVFKPLELSQVESIAKLRLKEVEARLQKKGISFKASDEAIAELAKRGFDPKFGARPLKRVIEDQVDNSLANFLLQGEIERRDIAVLEKDGSIRVEKAQKL